MAKYANLHGYSDIVPYEVVRVISEKTMEVRVMKATLGPNWKPEIVPGGFLGHCMNMDSQTYIYESEEQYGVIKIRKQKNGQWKSIFGRHILSDRPIKFYDYNF